MTVWVVDCQTTKGDCGSWVVDQVQQVLYGIVVAHDPEMAETYIVPAHAIFQDIRRMFDVAPETEALLSSSEPLLWRPAQRSPTRHEYSPKRTQSSSPKYSFGTGSSTSRIGAAASRGHLQQLIRERASGPAFSLPVFALDAPASTRSLALRSRHAMHADPCTSLDSPPDVDLDRITFARLEGEGSDAGPEDELDRRYRQRTARDAGRLFQVGRVFSVQKHEDFNGDPKTYHTTPGCLLTKTSRGWIISRNSQYVVVKEGHGFCWAIPITTYGGLGTCKRGLSAAEVEAHAVVYSTSKPPSLLDGERPLTKTHIAVNCHGDHQLHRASRINFAKVTTIEHNVRVMDIGRIAPESLAHFNEYWKDEVFKQYGRRR
ncbi:uncharacterized protein HMPREF1541_02315 [Cyphellophora europaea CBS 101466]|uniref:DUF6590 domain-containing protein n=1 Tax=Cyphellophora europaea (strain CBS 101466) TaxID=1220924 RepID=W2S389_CYPE1|nr:uncharacterized protein HMPREF1541_02315 [Cyphellophora europaea CBS 101466]ETN43157.1 hypothetical protein HMPREF1541_02315 [Cyphellophora europaea CBS 101466]